MQLNIEERVVLTNILNMEGSIQEVSLNLDIYQKIKFSEEETKTYFLNDGTINKKVKDKSIAVEFTGSECRRVSDIFILIGEQKKMNFSLLPVYKKFQSKLDKDIC